MSVQKSLASLLWNCLKWPIASRPPSSAAALGVSEDRPGGSGATLCHGCAAAGPEAAMAGEATRTARAAKALRIRTLRDWSSLKAYGRRGYGTTALRRDPTRNRAKGPARNRAGRASVFILRISSARFAAAPARPVPGPWRASGRGKPLGSVKLVRVRLWTNARRHDTVNQEAYGSLGHGGSGTTKRVRM